MVVENVKLTGQHNPLRPTVNVTELTPVGRHAATYQLFRVRSAIGPEKDYFDDAEEALKRRDVLVYPVWKTSRYEKFLLENGVRDSNGRPLDLELSGDIIRNIKTSNLLERPAILSEESYVEFAVRGVRVAPSELKNQKEPIDPFEVVRKQLSKTAYKKPEVADEKKEQTLGPAWRSYLLGKKE